MTEEEKLLLARIEDVYSLCDKYCCARFTQFLDAAQQQVILDNVGARPGYHTGFFGGYPDAQRKVFGVFPEWCPYSEADFSIKVLKIIKNFGEPLTHRDYLGTILSLGIDRAKTGDILVDGDTAWVFLLEDIADFVAGQIRKVSNRGVKTELVPLEDAVIPQQKFQTKGAVVASLRLDAVVAAMADCSRNIACRLVESGKVSVNHRQTEETAKGLKPGDVISIRGHGRFVLAETGGKTRSDRLHILIKKYI